MTEGLEPWNDPSMDALADVEGTVEGWALPVVCSAFDDMQPSTVVFRQQQVVNDFPTTVRWVQERGVLCGERQHQMNWDKHLYVEYKFKMKLQRVPQAIPFNEEILYTFLGGKSAVASILCLYESELDSVGTNRLVDDKCVIRHP